MSSACLMVIGLVWPWELFLTLYFKISLNAWIAITITQWITTSVADLLECVWWQWSRKVGILAHLSSTAAGTCLSAFLDHFWFQSVLGHTARCLIHFPHLTVWINLCGQCVVNDNNSVGEMDVMRSILFWIFLSHFKCKVI